MFSTFQLLASTFLVLFCVCAFFFFLLYFSLSHAIYFLSFVFFSLAFLSLCCAKIVSLRLCRIHSLFSPSAADFALENNYSKMLIHFVYLWKLKFQTEFMFLIMPVLLNSVTGIKFQFLTP